MKLREYESMSKKYLLPYLPDFAAKGKLIFRTPVDQLLCAFIFEPSAWDKNQFRIEVFVQPLYLPWEHIVFLIGHDLGLISEKNRLQVWWNITEGTDKVMTDVRKRILSAGLQLLNEFYTPHDVAIKATQNSENLPDHPSLLLAIAYSWIVCGKRNEALEVLRRLGMVLGNLDASIPWVREMACEVTGTEELLRIDVEKAKERLMEYRRIVMAKFGLEKWSVERH